MSRVQVLLPLPEVNRIAKRFAVLLFSIDRGSHIPECSQSYKIEWLTCAWLPLFFYSALGNGCAFHGFVGDRVSSRASSVDCT